MPETIDISLQFENMLSLLFGKNNHHGDIGNMGKTDWKKNLLKIINAIEKSFSQNVNYTDECQKTELDILVKQLKSKVSASKSINQTNHEDIINVNQRRYSVILGEEDPSLPKTRFFIEEKLSTHKS